MNLARYCLTNADADPHKAALEVVGEEGKLLERWTYGDLTTATLGIAAGLLDQGLQRGDRVLLRIGHSSDFPLVFFGAIAAGLVPVPTSSLLTKSETAAILADCGAAAILHDGKTALPDCSTSTLLDPDAIAAWKQREPAPFANTEADDPAFLIYTSGTSGNPKGVLHAQRAAFARRPMYDGWYGMTPEDRLLHAGAFNWTYTLGVGLMDPWANGATSLVYDGPRDPELWPKIIEESGATLFAAVPSLYRRILKYGTLSKSAFPTLRHGLTAGEALPASLYEEWVERTGRNLYEALGMSEISTYLSSGPKVPVKPGSPGRPQVGRKVAILSEHEQPGELVADGTTGLLAIHRSEPGLMLGYWKNDEATEETFCGDWFLTGDRAKRDSDGYFWYEGRADDLMNAFGYRVAPEEIERALSAHPGVAEVAVTAVSSGNIQLITAFVVVRESEKLDADMLANFAASNLAEYKRPKAYRFVSQLPRTPSGKIRRKALAESPPSPP